MVAVKELRTCEKIRTSWLFKAFVSIDISHQFEIMFKKDLCFLHAQRVLSYHHYQNHKRYGGAVCQESLILARGVFKGRAALGTLQARLFSTK